MAKDLAYFFYDSALNGGVGGFHAVSQAGFPATPVVGSNAQLSGSSTGGGVTATWTASELVAEVTLGGEAVKGANLSLSFNGAGTGLNGMDTGSVPTSGQLAVYAIYNPTTQAWGTLGYAADGSAPALIYPGANAPAGYTYSTLIHSEMTDASAHLRAFRQRGFDIYLNNISALSSIAAVAGTYYSLSLAAYVPPGAVTVSGVIAGSGNFDLEALVASDGSGSYAQYVVGARAGAALNGYYAGGKFNDLPLITPQTIYWASGNTTQTVNILLTRYSLR